MSEWIKVTEQLPSKTGTQIVTVEADRGFFRSVGFFTADNRWFVVAEVDSDITEYVIA